MTLACGSQPGANSVIRATITPLPSLTATLSPESVAEVLPLIPTPLPTNTPTPIPATATPAATFTPIPTDTPTPTDTPALPPPPPPAETPLPPLTDTPTLTPTPEPLIKYVIAGSNREFNCEFTYIYGTVQNANNIGLPDVEVRALGIHETTGLDFTIRTDAEGHYEAFRFPLPDLLAAQWAVMLIENGREVSERFHWASTPVCESDDLGHSQVLRLDWKLIE